jgi:hypothetical protein
MGRWGPGPFDSDFALDVRDRLDVLLEQGLDEERSLHELRQEFSDALSDPEAREEFWSAVRATFDVAKLGRSQDEVRHQPSRHRRNAAPEPWLAESEVGSVFEYAPAGVPWRSLFLMVGHEKSPTWGTLPIVAVLDWRGPEWTSDEEQLEQLRVRAPVATRPPHGWDLRKASFPRAAVFTLAPTDRSDDPSSRLRFVGRAVQLAQRTRRDKLRAYAWWDTLDPYIEWLFESD